MEVLKVRSLLVVAAIGLVTSSSTAQDNLHFKCGGSDEIVHMLDGDERIGISFDDEGSWLQSDSSLQKCRSKPVQMPKERFDLLAERYEVDGIIGRDVLSRYDLVFLRNTSSIKLVQTDLNPEKYPLKAPIVVDPDGYYMVAQGSNLRARFKLRSLYLNAASNQFLPNIPEPDRFSNSGQAFDNLPLFARFETRKEIESTELCNFGILLVNSDEVVISLKSKLVGMRDYTEFSKIKFLMREFCNIRFEEQDGQFRFPKDSQLAEKGVPADAVISKINDIPMSEFIAEAQKPFNQLLLSIYARKFSLKTIEVEKDGQSWIIDMIKKDGEPRAWPG